MPNIAYIMETAAARADNPNRWLPERALDLGFTVAELARIVGAQRNTVYSWVRGANISPAYRQKVRALFTILSTSNNKEEAWSRIEQDTFLKP
jgi:transposase-like protein